jgi:hypothetical protein
MHALKSLTGKWLHSLGPPTVLVADVTRIAATLSAHILAQRGYQPWNAAMGGRLELIMNQACNSSTHPLDLDMPITNREQFIGALRRPSNLVQLLA